MDSKVNQGSRSNEIDMLNGPLFRKILVFALPLAASSLLQELFNSVDVAVVGHFVGSEALAAVGSNAPVIGLLINLFMGISMGACAIISNHIGQQDDRSIRRSISTVQLVAVLSGLFLLVLGQVAARPILIWMGTPPEVLDLHGFKCCFLCRLQLAFCLAGQFLSGILLGRTDGTPLWSYPYAHCTGSAIHCQQLRDCRLFLAGDGQITDSGSADGFRNLSAPGSLGVCRVSVVERI